MICVILPTRTASHIVKICQERTLFKVFSHLLIIFIHYDLFILVVSCVSCCDTAIINYSFLRFKLMNLSL